MLLSLRDGRVSLATTAAEQRPFLTLQPEEQSETAQIGLATAPAGGQAGTRVSEVLLTAKLKSLPLFEVAQIGLATAPVGDRREREPHSH